MEAMNTATILAESPLKRSEAVVLTLNHDKNKSDPPATRISANLHSARNLVSGLAHSVWAAPRTLRGIRELDSPLAG
jgi:hypothetical protein